MTQPDLRLPEGLRVFVYFNLIKNLYSVRCMKTKKVIAHVDSLVLSDVQYKVSQAGRARVIRDRQKNVHAGLLGFIGAFDIELDRVVRVTYNPYRDTSFVSKTEGKEVKESDFALLCLNEDKLPEVWATYP